MRLRRAGLKAALSGLELALAAPGAEPRRLGDAACATRSTSVHEVWTRHIVETEAPGAFLDELVERGAAPVDAGVAAAARAQRDPRGDHRAPRSELAVAAAGRRRTTRGSTSSAPSSPTLLVALAPHRQRGADLVYEAYDVDIGGGF